MKSNIILFAGGMGVGKTHVAYTYAEEIKRFDGKDTHTLSFASAIKFISYNLGVSKDAEIDIVKSAVTEFDVQREIYNCLDILVPLDNCKSIAILVSKYSYNVVNNDSTNAKIIARQIMQTIGDVSREVKLEAFSNRAVYRISQAEMGWDVFLIDDLRYVNELEAVVEAYGVHNVFVKIVETSEVQRAINLGVTIEELREMSKHSSENELVKIRKYCFERGISYSTIHNYRTDIGA